MNILYFTRHGETIWNVENKICGATDIALTEKGHAQAIALGQRIRDEQIPIDVILYSPLVRAADTAKHISEITGIPAFSEPALTEQNFGKYEGTPRDGAEFLLAKAHISDRFDGGESMLQLGQRIYNLLDRLKDDPRTILLVAHGGIARMVRTYFEDLSNEDFARCGLKNCELLRYEFK